MADSTLTTVVIVSCNYGRFLPAAMQSVIGQTMRPKILIVDDGSTDESPRLIAQLAKDDPAIASHFLPANIGLARLRNHAAALATTEWVVYLDADDWLDTRYIASGESWLRTHPPVDVLTTDMTIVGPAGSRRRVRSRVPRFWDDLLVRNTIVQSSFIRRSLILDLGGYDPALDFEDWDFWIRVMQAGGRIARLPGPYVFWRDHGANKSKSCDEARAAQAVRGKHRGSGRP